MDKTNNTEFQRTFLLEALPEPLTRARSHIQIFDNYIADTRIRLRSIRDPQTRSWTRILQQRFPIVENDLTVLKIAEIYLNDTEYNRFKFLEGAEIRKNRYFHEFDLKIIAFDVYMGELWGLNIAKIEFENIDNLQKFEPPRFLFLEVTNNVFFSGEQLVSKKLTEVQEEVAKYSFSL